MVVCRNPGQQKRSKIKRKSVKVYFSTHCEEGHHLGEREVQLLMIARKVVLKNPRVRMHFFGLTIVIVYPWETIAVQTWW